MLLHPQNVFSFGRNKTAPSAAADKDKASARGAKPAPTAADTEVRSVISRMRGWLPSA